MCEATKADQDPFCARESTETEFRLAAGFGL